MIAVPPVLEPQTFDAKVRKPGKRWLAANPTAKRPSPLWTPYTGVLAAGFRNLCGYAAMLDPTGGTVDHYLSFTNHSELAYEWSNYRYASATLNSIKRNADDTVLDPHEVQAGWFEIILPSLQMRLTDAVPPALRAKAEHTLTRLKLRDGERIVRWRQSWYALYQQGDLTLDGLRQVAPLLADAVERAGRVLAGREGRR
jgi:hypothetical protein